MLTIATEKLPQSCLSYVAFRVAFRETLERITLASQVGEPVDGGFGYLIEVPFLQAVPPHVQLDLLAATWQRHIAEEDFTASLLDESVLYAVCEASAGIVDSQPEMVRQYLAGGPQAIEIGVDHQLAAELRALHQEASREGAFLLISQFQDMPPEEARPLKAEWGLKEERLEVMFEALGRWRVSPEFLSNLAGLLTAEEIGRTVKEFATR